MEIKISETQRKSLGKLPEKLWTDFFKKTGLVLDEKDHFFSVKEDKKIIGYMHIKITSDVAYLEDMIVENEYRNKGIGRMMLKCFEELSERNKCRKMRIKTCPELMPSAYDLYLKCGFTEEARLKTDYFKKDWLILCKYTK